MACGTNYSSAENLPISYHLEKNKVGKEIQLGKNPNFSPALTRPPCHLSNITSSLHPLRFRLITLSAPETHQTQSYLTALALTAQITLPLALCMPMFFSSFGTQPAPYSCSDKCSLTISSLKESPSPLPSGNH